MIGWNLVCPRQRQNRFAHRPLRQRLVVVEQRRDEHRIDEAQEQRVREREARRPDPPARSGATHTRVKDRQHDRPDDECHRQPEQRFAQPARERQVRQAVLVLAHEALVDRQREIQHRRGDDEQRTVDRDAEPGLAAHPLREIAHAAAPARPQQDGHDAEAVEQRPELEPITALEIRVGQRTLFRRE